MPGKYFVIVSRANDMVLDVQGASEEPGAKVITWERSESNNQLWYIDSTTGTIRSKQTDYCLDVEVTECADDTSSSSSSSSDEDEIQYQSTLVVNPFNADEPNQRWRLSDDFIRKRDEPEKVLDLTEDPSEQGSRVCVWEAHGADNQKWYFDYVEPRYFLIVSELNSKVLDVSGADPSPGTKVITWERHEDAEDNQLWYEDKHGVIRSKLNNLVLDTSSGILRTGEPEIGNGYQMWQRQGSQIACKVAPNDVLDIHRGNTDDGAEIHCFPVHHGENQCWHFEYV